MVVINYADVLNQISKQFDMVKGDYNVLVCDEQAWIDNYKDDPDKDTIYVVVSFGSSSINFGRSVLSLELQCLSLPNEVNKSREVLNKYVSTFNQLQTGDTTQLYLTPRVSLNFNEVHAEYRTLFTIAGTFVVGNDTVDVETLTYHYGDGSSEEIEVIGFVDDYENSLNPQPYPNTGGRAKSYSAFGTYTFSFTTYPDSNKQLIKDLWKMKYGIDRNHQNDTFKFSLVFKNMADYPMPEWEFKCRSIDFTKKIGEVPVISVTFSL